MTLLLALVVALIPLAIAPGVFFYFDVTPKIVLLLLGTAAAVVWWAVEGASGFSRASREARWFLWVVCGMACVAGRFHAGIRESGVVAGRKQLAVLGPGDATRGAGAGVYLVAVVLRGPARARLRVMLRAVAASGLIGALYGIAQYFGWDPLLDARGYHVGEGIWAIVRPPSTLGHADYFRQLAAVRCVLPRRRWRSRNRGPAGNG
jgi:hypothetical protein